MARYLLMNQFCPCSFKKRERNWVGLTFAQTSGTVSTDREKNLLTGASPVSNPETIVAFQPSSRF